MIPRTGRALAATAWLALTTPCCGPKEFGPVPELPAAPARADAVIYLIGDAGLAHLDDPIIRQLHDDVTRAAADAPTLVVFLGDNVYSKGLHAPGDADREKEKRYLDAQAFVVRGTGAQAIFMPGNHDWGYSDRRGLEQLTRQAAYIDSLAAAGAPVKFEPPPGCPGPASVRVGARALVLLLDTDLWLRDEQPSEGCASRSTGSALAELERALSEEADGRHVLVLGHHPLETHGPHGGHYTLRDYLFPGTNLWKPLYIPLPFLYPLIRSMGVSSQDLASSRYREMRDSLAAAFLGAPEGPLVYGSGHTHGLEVLEGRELGVDWLLVSGAGSKLTSVGEDDAPFAAGAQNGEQGFMRLTFFADGRVLLAVISDGTESCPDGAGPCPGRASLRYWRWLSE